MRRPAIWLHDGSGARAERIRTALLTFVGGIDLFVANRELESLSRPDIVIIGDPEFSADTVDAPGIVVVKARYSLTRVAWRMVSSVPWGATVGVSAAPDVLSTLGDALRRLERPDIELLPEGTQPLGASRSPCHLRVQASGRNSETTREEEIDLPVVSFGTVLEVLGHLGRLEDFAQRAVREYLHQVEPLPEDSEFLLDHVSGIKARVGKALSLCRQAIIHLDRNGRVLDVAGTVEALLERRTEELLGRPLQDVCPELARLSAETFGSEQQIFIGDHPLVARVALMEDRPVGQGGLLITLMPLEGQRGTGCPRAVLEPDNRSARRCVADIIGISPSLEKARQLAVRVGRSDSSVLLIGESGTGKELFAQGMHTMSARGSSPFIAINCAAIPESLIESEVFGYEAGAFTGAHKGGRPSVFERANHGTLFLDELADMSHHMQTALLRVLEERAVTRVGGSRSIPVDVRVIGATNRCLDELVTEGHFRRDLYHRLCVIPIPIPPLRERVEDISVLVRHFLQMFGDRRELPPDVMRYLMRYRWPGNVRELRHCIEYMITVADADFTVKDLPPPIIAHVGIESDKPLEQGTVGTERRIEPGTNARSGNPGDNATSVHSPDIKLTPLDLFILRALATANRSGKGLGRRSLAQQARTEGFVTTEGVIRTRLQALKLNSMLQWNLGRGGITLTVRGSRSVETITTGAQ